MRFLKKTLRIFAWTLLFLYLGVALLPKEALFYQAEKMLAPMKIFINETDLSDHLLTFNLEAATFIYQDIEAATIDEISLTALLFYNSLSVSPFQIKEELAGFIPPGIETLRMTHTILMPHRISIEAAGDFGSAQGYVDLLAKKVRVNITFSSLVNRNYRALLKMVKKDSEGYYYEQAF